MGIGRKAHVRVKGEVGSSDNMYVCHVELIHSQNLTLSLLIKDNLVVF